MHNSKRGNKLSNHSSCTETSCSNYKEEINSAKRETELQAKHAKRETKAKHENTQKENVKKRK